MKLTTHTDYALRVLIHVGLSQGRLVRIAEIAGSFGISHNHLTKVVQRLAALGCLETVQGRNGGVRLAREPDAITVGEVVRHLEADIPVVECFNRGAARCRIQGACVLKQSLADASEAFLQSLDCVTLADLLEPRRPLTRLLIPSKAMPATRVQSGRRTS